jgi:hypothetical protein
MRVHTQKSMKKSHGKKLTMPCQQAKDARSSQLKLKARAQEALDGDSGVQAQVTHAMLPLCPCGCFQDRLCGSLCVWCSGLLL